MQDSQFHISMLFVGLAWVNSSFMFCQQCVQYVDESVLPELVPRFTELVKSGIGVGTKVGISCL